ncbi:hypothetical protein GCM10022254_29680 [Actinomadura meridiana]|uniref:N-acetyltransferase domain-containing protein n=1 Tax=Actinomadura meridiana TaxID=559626 RepID=A0ABP8C0Z2_9ACTN
MAFPEGQKPDESVGQGGNGEFEFVEVADVDDDVFDRLYRDVLQQAFPPSELGNLETLKAEYRPPPPGNAGTVALDGGEPVGAALGEYSTVSGVMLLSYLAVRGDMRGRGLGTKLLGRALPLWRKTFGPVATLAEVEDPRCHRAGPHGDPVARLRLYDRIGARMLPLAYLQPALNVGLPRVRGMLLICLDPELDAVPRGALLAFLDEYVIFCEGEKALRNEPEFRAQRDRILALPEDVPLWSLSRVAEVPRTEFETVLPHSEG